MECDASTDCAPANSLKAATEAEEAFARSVVSALAEAAALALLFSVERGDDRRGDDSRTAAALITVLIVCGVRGLLAGRLVICSPVAFRGDDGLDEGDDGSPCKIPEPVVLSGRSFGDHEGSGEGEAGRRGDRAESRGVPVSTALSAWRKLAGMPSGAVTSNSVERHDGMKGRLKRQAWRRREPFGLGVPVE